MAEKELSLTEVIDYFGFGLFSLKLICVTGLLWFFDGIEMTLITLIAPRLKCEWNMTNIETALTSVSVFIGMATGCIFWGKLADKFGRRKFALFGTGMTLYFGLLSTITSNFALFSTVRFFVGIGIGSLMLAPCYISELISTKYQGKVMISLQFFFGFGNVYVACLAYMVMNKFGWRVFLLLAASPILLSCTVLFWLPESVRYLENVGNIHEIIKVLHVISVNNKKPIPKKIKFEQRVKKRGDISELFIHKYRLHTTLSLILWSFTYTSSYGLQLLNTQLDQTIGQAGKSSCHSLTNIEYLQNIFVVLGQIPGLLFYILFADKISRKTAFISTYVIILACLLLLLKLSAVFYVRTGLMFVLRATTSSSAQLLWLHSAENTLSSFRATALGLYSSAARWSMALSPILVQYLLNVSFTATIFVFIFFNVISCIIVWSDKASLIK